MKCDNPTKVSGDCKARDNLLNTHEVLAGCNAGWECEIPPPISSNHCINGPFRSCGIESFFCNLEPRQTSRCSSSSIGDLRIIRQVVSCGASSNLCQVHNNRTFVTRSNGIIRIVRSLWTTNEMLIQSSYFSTSWDLNDGRRNWCLKSSITSEVLGENILDWIVG